MRAKILIPVVLVACVLLVGWYLWFRTPPGKEPFTVLLDWQAEPTYLGVYYAKSLGEFDKIGLDVTIEQSRGSNQAVAAVAAGKYKIATASAGATVLGHNSGAKVVSLGVLYPKVTTVAFGLASTPIREPKDLIGKRVGIYPGSINNNEFDAFVRLTGLDRSKIQVEAISGPDLPLLKSGKLDAVLNYAEMSPTVLMLDKSVPEVDGRRTFEIRLSDSGVNCYGLNVICSREALAAEPERVRAVARAIFEGYRKAAENPEAAVTAFCQEFPNLDREFVAKGWQRTVGFINGNYGDQTPEGWQSTIDLYQQLKLLQQPIAPRDILP